MPIAFSLALLVAPNLKADTITYSVAFGLDVNGVPMYAPYLQPISLPKFNPAMGQLTGVQLSFSDVDYFAAPEVRGSAFLPTTVYYTDIAVRQSITLTAPDAAKLTNTLTEGPGSGSEYFSAAQDLVLFPELASSNIDSGGPFRRAISIVACMST